MAFGHEKAVAILAKLDQREYTIHEETEECRTNQIDPDIDPDPRETITANQAVRRQDTVASPLTFGGRRLSTVYQPYHLMSYKQVIINLLITHNSFWTRYLKRKIAFVISCACRFAPV